MKWYIKNQSIFFKLWGFTPHLKEKLFLDYLKNLKRFIIKDLKEINKIDKKILGLITEIYFNLKKYRNLSLLYNKKFHTRINECWMCIIYL